MQLVVELNQLGCQRTVVEWQHIWDVWRSKTKTKARKVRDSINGTGGGPAIPGLTDLDNKILDIVGSASVYGFTHQEQGLPLGSHEQQLHQDDQVPPPPLGMPEQSVHPLQVPEGPLLLGPHVPPVSARTNRRNRRTRMARPRTARPRTNENLVQALTENGRLMREAINTAGTSIAVAIREHAAETVRAAQILAAAIRSIGVVAVEEAIEEEAPT